MFWKKTCRRCGKKIEKGFSYCPHCGFSLIDKEREQKDYGFLGKDDFIEPFFQEPKLPFGLNFVFKNLIKEMDKQFRELDKQIGIEKKEEFKKLTEDKDAIMKKGGLSINISSSSENGIPVIRVKSFGNIPELREEEKKIKQLAKQPKIEINKEQAKKLAKLPRQEAESKVRRLSGKVIYEIEIPGVKNLKDVFVNELENSIEIKAFSKDKAYFKFLPVALPLLKYALKKEKLILELGEK